MPRHDFKNPNKQKLKQFLLAQLKDIELDQIEPLISGGHVFVDGKRIRKIHYVLKEGARVVVHLQAIESPPSVECLHVSEHFLVVNKKPGDHVNETETSARLSLIETVQQTYPEAQIVHRLDRETSGVLLFGRGPLASRLLSQCFEKRSIRKSYLALVEGRMSDSEILNGSISKDPRSPRTYRVHNSGKPARTEIQPLGSTDGISAVSARPITGRTHQIRVHLSHAGFPILGDRRYGGPTAIRLAGDTLEIGRVMLHAAELEIPTSSYPWAFPNCPDRLKFSAKLPPDMKEISAGGLALDAVFK